MLLNFKFFIATFTNEFVLNHWLIIHFLWSFNFGIIVWVISIVQFGNVWLDSTSLHELSFSTFETLNSMAFHQYAFELQILHCTSYKWIPNHFCSKRAYFYTVLLLLLKAIHDHSFDLNIQSYKFHFFEVWYYLNSLNSINTH